ncbi:MAG: hypothetical protein RLZ12_724 [Bacillota bacterium]
MRRGLMGMLLGGMMVWLFYSLRQRDTKNMERLIEVLAERAKKSIRRGLLIGRVMPTILVRKALRRFS